MEHQEPVVNTNRTPTNSPNPGVWKKQPTKYSPRGPGIPATHIDEISNDFRKTEFWSRKQGRQVVSIFHNDDTGNYFVHHAVTSMDWTYGPYETSDAAQEKLEAVKDNPDGKH